MNASWLLALVPLGLNLFASRAVLRAPFSTPSQRRLQLALVWLLPAIGAVLCLVFAASQRGERRPGSDDGANTMPYAVLPADGSGDACTSSQAGDCGGGDGGGGGGD